MKTPILTQLTATLALSLITASVFAAPTNSGSKLTCPFGKVAVIENGQWHCEDATIKSNQSSSNASRPTIPSAKTAPAPKAPLIKAEVLPLPDFQILGVKKLDAAGSFEVIVKNNGASTNKQAALWANHYKQGAPSPASASVYMPQSFPAGQVKKVNLTFNPANFDRGERVSFEVDYFKNVAEKNENNNKFSLNY